MCSPVLPSHIVKYKSACNPEKLDKIESAIAVIQASIGWDEEDLEMTRGRLESLGTSRITVKDSSSRELIGYAILVPQQLDGLPSWYLSQIAVIKALHGKGIGKEIMQQIFREARHQGLNRVTLHTDGSDEQLVRFYRSVAKLEGIHIRLLQESRSRFGLPRLKLCYEVGSVFIGFDKD
ncbi:MAG: GNAT family N-acetyltransferase [Simkaniaceae bacterium]|nr:GNAT family N-acetyltransferase [Simkaniaceae bacterium]